MNQSNLRFGSGQSVLRLEDEALLKGVGKYTDDIVLKGQLRAVFLRSPYPHARIVSINTDAAAKMPGVQLVLTQADLLKAGIDKPLGGVDMFKRPDGSPANFAARHLLAHERVRFVGELVAVVVATTLEQARNACEAIEVEYQDLPHAVTIEDALAADAAPLSAGQDNIVAQTRYGDSGLANQAFSDAAHRVSLQLKHQRLAAVTIEPRSVLAYPQDQRLMIQLSSQMPTGVRTAVCNVLGLKTEDVRVLVSDVGGGFGMKTGAYPEDILVAYCAKRLGQPVKWIAERSEDFLSSAHGRDVKTHVEIALNDKGRILALRVESYANVGAYPSMSGVAIQLLIGPWVQTSVYDIEVIDFQFTAVATNTAPTGPYRGAGRPEAIFNIERILDEAARQSGIDRIALRRSNFVRPEQMPYKNQMGQTYDVGHFQSIMDQCLTLSDWEGFEQRAHASQARGLWRGRGISTFLEWTGGNALEEQVNVRILSDGVIEIFSAVNAMGQGIATSLAQLVVDVFDVPMSQVRVVLGDTDRGNGFGSAGSRSLFTGGSAVSVGATQTLDKALELAAQKLEVSAQDIKYQRGTFVVQGTDIELSLSQLAASQANARIEVDSKTSASGPTWPNGCHICEVEVDPQTGETQIVKYTSVNDAGRVVNPLIVIGQIEGGAVQGIGQALFEQVVYDQESGQLVTGSLMDYALPHADVMPQYFVTHTNTSLPSKNNLLGVKGVGELGTIGATPCVVNAVADALARQGLTRLTAQLQMPINPVNLWEIIKKA